MAYKKTVLLSLLIASIGLPQQAVASPGSDLLKFGSGILAGLALGYFYLTKKHNETINEKDKAILKLTAEKDEISKKNSELTKNAEEQVENQRLEISQVNSQTNASSSHEEDSREEEEKEVIEEQTETSLVEQINQLKNENKLLTDRIDTYIEKQKNLFPKITFRGKDIANTFLSNLNVLSGNNVSNKFNLQGLIWINIIEKK